LAQAANHWPLNVESQVNPMPVHVGFVMNEVAKDFLQRLQSSSLSIILQVLQTHISFTCDQFYITVATDSVAKWNIPPPLLTITLRAFC